VAATWPLPAQIAAALNRIGAITDVTGDQPHPSVVLAARLCSGSLGISFVDEAVSQSSAEENEQLWPRNRPWSSAQVSPPDAIFGNTNTDSGQHLQPGPARYDFIRLSQGYAKTLANSGSLYGRRDVLRLDCDYRVVGGHAR